MVQIRPEEIQGNVFDRVGKQWMLITAGEPGGDINTMTASWGGFGVLWGKPVAFCVIRPQRHTFSYIEKAERYTLSFYSEAYRHVLQLCGSKSGRDVDKAEAAGLSPVLLDSGVWTYEQAELTVECHKYYAGTLKEEHFLHKSTVEQWYPDKDFHKMYFGEITAVYEHI